jgi:hypothetical protein
VRVRAGELGPVGPQELRDTMNEQINPTRRLAAVFLAVGVVGMLANQWFAVDSHEVYGVILFLGPFLILLGAGGLFDPRIPWAIGKHGVAFPRSVKATAAVLALSAVAISVVLLRVYGLWE